MPDRGIIMLWLLSSIAIINSMVNGYDGSMMTGLQSLTQWETSFGNPTGAQLGLLNAIFNAGGTCGVPFGPFLSDWAGRRWGIFVGSVIIIVGTILQAASQNVNMFIGARFLIGFGLAISSNAAPILVAELAHPKFRGTITGLYNTQWPLGGILAAWITYGTFQMQGDASWRIPSALQAVPSTILIVCLPFIPESPRWLVAKERSDEARAILGRLHGNGNPHDPLVDLEMDEIQEALDFQKANADTRWFELVGSPGNRYRMFLAVCVGLFSQWSGNGLTGYYLSKILNQIGVTDPKFQLRINGGKQIQAWFLANLGAWLTDRVPRRWQFLGGTAGMMICFSCLTIFTGLYQQTPSYNLGIGAIVFMFFFGACYSLGWQANTTLYPTEIMPYRIRAKGLAVSTMTVNLALFFNSYINPIGMASLSWKYYFVYVAWLPIEVLTIFFFFKETKGHTLEELAVIFDGEQAAVAGTRLGVDPAHAQVTEEIVEKALHAHDTPTSERSSDIGKEEKATEHLEIAPPVRA
ncbi:MFS sugar transporter-like protein [Calocera viscosa TUFC12733]|uniref:MFS sugar transporter-like protein n=1 Tax=Calocera viscosa (strain TUFC12733) TaxID=1330018 RepID=A0A167LWP0_CALVF|nr:MFS sugar transporter-like protein [Calocera viscosa TUFC12733]